MRLLVCTQAVDLDDRALGFFHRWLEEFSARFDSIEVICLKEGRHALPQNVSVHSLGKESGRSRVAYVRNFYRHIWRLRHSYDVVFVHMNQEYVLMGALMWKLLGKRVVMWRNHKKGSLFTDLACMLSDDICFTSPESYVARKPRAHKMPIGIDTKQFVPAAQPPAPDSLLFLGRFDPVKKVKEFAAALVLVHAHGSEFHADIVGSPTQADSTYPAQVKATTEALEREGVLRYAAGVAHQEVPALYAAHAFYVNVTPSGSFDKTIGEACATGAIPIVANTVVRGVVPDALIVDPDSPEDIARGIKAALALPEADRRALAAQCREWVEREHSLALLAGRLACILS